MNRFSISTRFLAAAALATAALGTATVSEAARPDINVTVDFQSGPGWVQPSRGYYAEPRPVYVQPAPVYVRPPVFVSPREVLEQPRFGRYDGRFEWEREQAWRRAEWRRHEWRAEHRGWDRDHDRDDRGGHRGHRD